MASVKTGAIFFVHILCGTTHLMATSRISQQATDIQRSGGIFSFLKGTSEFALMPSMKDGLKQISGNYIRPE